MILEDDTIIICNNSLKYQILKNRKELNNIKFYTKNGFIKKLYFDFDEKTILYLINSYNLNYDNALEYLNNLIYVENKNYDNYKLDFLVKIKNELIDNNLLIFDYKFKDYIKDKKIIIYDNLTKFEKYLFKNLKYEEGKEPQKNYLPDIYEFSTGEEEINFIAIKISELINSGIPIEKIKLTNVSQNYLIELKKIFDFYNLKINKSIDVPIIATVIGKTFYANLESVTKAIDSISKYKNTDIYNSIINICNKYIWCDDINDLKKLVYHDLNNNYIKEDLYTNVLEIVDYNDYYFTDEYVFMMNFNQDIIPINYKDEDYINDAIKPLYLDNTVEKNIYQKNIILAKIKNIKNLVITYKLKDNFNTFYPSLLIEDLNVLVNHYIDNDLISYSSIYDEIKLAKKIEDFIKFNKQSEELNLLNSNYLTLYNSYSNIFTGLNNKKLNNYIASLNEFNLSYTSMDNYNRCAFRFYISKILNLNEKDEKFSLTLGNIYHDILKNYKTVDIEKEIDNYIKNNNIVLNNADKFFINKAITNIKRVINVIIKQDSYSELNNILAEKKVKINLKNNINFIGFIDKICYNVYDDKVIAAIIDYKTYVKKPTLKYLNYGIDLQLPVYMYLAKNIFSNVIFAGFYLQNITDNSDLKLIGFSNKDKEVLSKFDNTYENSSVISGLKVNNDGNFSQNSLKNMMLFLALQMNIKLKIVIYLVEDICKYY